MGLEEDLTKIIPLTVEFLFKIYDQNRCSLEVIMNYLCSLFEYTGRHHMMIITTVDVILS